MDERAHQHQQDPNGTPAWPSFLGPQPSAAAPAYPEAPTHQHAPAPAPHAGYGGFQYAPAPGHEAYPQQPHQQQHAQHHAPQPFVSPGSPGGEAPFSSQGGFVGTAAPQHAPQHAPRHAPQYAPQHAPHMQGHQQHAQQHASYAGAPAAAHPHAAPGFHAHAQQPYQHGGAATQLQPHPQDVANSQAFAFPTPQGFQVVHGSGAPGSPVSTHAVGGASASAAALAARPGSSRSIEALRARFGRLRWETIVPAAAIVLFVVAVGLFVADFDRITGRDEALPAAPASTEPAPMSAEDQAAALDQVRSLFALGRYAEASAMLDPMLKGDTPPEAAVALQGQVVTAAKRNDELLALLGRQRQAGSWMGVVTTIGKVRALHPLTPELVTVRKDAERRVRNAAIAKKATAKAKRLHASGQTAEAIRVLDNALKGRPNASMSRMRMQLLRRAAAGGGGSKVAGAAAAKRPARQAAPAAAPRAGAAPAPAGRPSSIPGAPPSRVGSGVMPPRPDAPNTGSAPTGGGITGTQPAVTAAGGGAGASCHTHDGVTECH